MSLSGRTHSPSTTGVTTRVELVAQLRERRLEIEQMLLIRASAVPDAAESDDPEYLGGLRTAVSAAFEYSLAAIEAGEGETPALPPALLLQARVAARNSVGLDVVLSRYVAGSALLDDITFDEINHPSWMIECKWQPLLRARAAALQQLLLAVATEYENERTRRTESREAKLAARVRALLNCEPVDAASLGYNLDAHHLGLAARGEGAPLAIRDLAKALDCRLLMVRPSDDSVWAWLGARRSVETRQFDAAIESHWPPALPIALGDNDSGIGGWRQTHRQAKSALPIALRGPNPIVRYRDVCLLASMLQDDLLTTSLRSMYLQPLLDSRDGGETYLRTLRSYFAANRNAASTAASLGVSRQTVNNRLRAIEGRLGRPLRDCASSVEAALHLAGGYTEEPS